MLEIYTQYEEEFKEDVICERYNLQADYENGFIDQYEYNCRLEDLNMRVEEHYNEDYY